MKVSAKNNKKLRILFIYRSWSSFVKDDYEIISKHFEVKKLQWRGKRDIFKMAVCVLKSDLTFSWFAEDHTAVAVFFSKLFRKKSIAVVGGGDAAYIPEINYGAFTLGWHKRMLTKFALKHADILLPVSKFTKNEILKKVRPKGKIIVVYNGVDTNMFKSNEKKERIIVTIGSKIKLKGIDTFIQVVEILKNMQFILIGANDLKSSKNLISTGKIPHKKVSEWLQKAKVYCQLSYIESFGVGVAEAMASGCIPVVTRKGALPEVVGDCGFYVPYGDEKATAEAIKKALDAPEELGKKARERIIKMFPLEKREKELVRIIRVLVKKYPYSTDTKKNTVVTVSGFNGATLKEKV